MSASHGGALSKSIDNTQRLRVLVSVSDPIVKAGIAVLLGEHSDVRVVPTGHDATAVLRAIKEHTPDVVLLDATMRGLIGDLVAARRCDVGSRPWALVAAGITDVPDDGHPPAAPSSGFEGIFVASDDIDFIMRVLRSSPKGKSRWQLSGSRIRRAPNQKESGSRYHHGSPPASVKITAKERSVLSLIAAGHTDREISALVFRSVRAVKYHVSNLLIKFNARNRAHLVSLAMSEGMLNPAQRGNQICTNDTG